MHLTDDDLRAFQAIWKAEFGEAITLDQGRESASRLLELYRFLCRRERSQ